MNKLRRFSLYSIPLMIVLLSLWLTIGRALFGSIGWDLIIMIVAVIPLLFLSLSILMVLYLCRHEVRTSRMTGELDAKLLTGFYASSLLFGFFLVSIGDTEEGMISVASRLLGSGFVTASLLLAILFGFVAVGLLAGALVVAVVELARSRKAPSKK